MLNKDVSSKSGFGIGGSNDGGRDSPDSVSGTEYDLSMLQKDPENSDKMQQENGQFCTMKLQKNEQRITSPIKMLNKDVSSKSGFGIGGSNDGVKKLQKNEQRITSPIKMLDKNVYSPSSKGDVNTAGHMQSDAGAGKCSEGGVPLDPYSDAGTDFSLLVIQSDTNGHEGTSKEISMSITPTMEVHNKDVCSSVNISGQKLPPRRRSKGPLTKAPLKAQHPRQIELGQSSKQSVSKTPRKSWTKAENEAFTRAFSDKPNITVAELNSLPELTERPRDSIKTKLKEHKTMPRSEATQRGKGWTTDQDDRLKAAYKIYGKNWAKLLEFAAGRTQKAVYDRTKKYDAEEKVGEQLETQQNEPETEGSELQPRESSVASGSGKPKTSEEYEAEISALKAEILALKERVGETVKTIVNAKKNKAITGVEHEFDEVIEELMKKI